MLQICNDLATWLKSVQSPLPQIVFPFLQMPVPALKEQIASVTGVLSERQRLICQGKVLKDDQLLSAYRILSLSFYFVLKDFKKEAKVAFSLQND